MTPIRETPVTPALPESSPRPARAWHPLKLFTDHAVAARLWCIIALIAVGLCALQPFLLVKALRSDERVVILDGAGTFSTSPLLAFEDAARLHEEHALLACLALFQRNPQTFDFPELLDRLYLPPAARKAREYATRTAEEF